MSKLIKIAVILAVAALAIGAKQMMPEVQLAAPAAFVPMGSL